MPIVMIRTHTHYVMDHRALQNLDLRVFMKNGVI